ncbi:hypothetical protein ACX9NE_27045 [Mycobacterium sp. ML4]
MDIERFRELVMGNIDPGRFPVSARLVESARRLLLSGDGIDTTELLADAVAALVELEARSVSFEPFAKRFEVLADAVETLSTRVDQQLDAMELLTDAVARLDTEKRPGG